LLPPEAAATARKLGLAPDAPLTRADACRLLFELALGVKPPATRE
jgi:hypothetical protein